MADGIDLTGSWEGIFSYPRRMPPNAFGCVLRDMGGMLTGEIHERSDAGEDRGEALVAIIEGRRTGRAVRFAKRYDALTRAWYAVQYEGEVGADGDEIAGRWTIPGDWSGSFIMVRAGGSTAQIERRASETVR